MAKTQAKTARAPEEMGIGERVTNDHPLAASKLVNWLYGRRRQSHLALTTAGDGWGTNGVGSIRAALAATEQTFIDTDAILDVDALAGDLTFSAEVTALDPGDTADVTITVDGELGTVTQTLSFTDADTTERRVSFSVAAATRADEWFRVRISGVKVGSGTYELIETELEEDEVTSGLPDPVEVETYVSLDGDTYVDDIGDSYTGDY